MRCSRSASKAQLAATFGFVSVGTYVGFVSHLHLHLPIWTYIDTSVICGAPAPFGGTQSGAQGSDLGPTASPLERLAAAFPPRAPLGGTTNQSQQLSTHTMWSVLAPCIYFTKTLKSCLADKAYLSPHVRIGDPEFWQ
jgi:hypothetical protein